MTEIWETFQLAPVPEVTEIDRATFEERFRGRSPVIVRGGAANTAAFENWDSGYLARTAGDALVSVAEYAADRRDYGTTAPREMTFGEFLAEMDKPDSDVVRYLFNNATCIFARNEGQPRFHVGWAAQANEGLAALATDFEVPRFIDPERFVIAVIILGSQQNATDLHYDHGGEGKVLVQVRGRKRLLLLPPTAAEALELNTLFVRPGTPPAQLGSRPAVDIHADADGSAASGLSGFTAELGPGDIAYWPPFWFHDLANLDPFTLAVGVMVDETTLPPLLMRHMAHRVYLALLAAADRRRAEGAEFDRALGGWALDVSLDGQRLASLGELFGDLEERLLAETPQHTDRLWEWNDILTRR